MKQGHLLSKQASQYAFILLLAGLPGCNWFTSEKKEVSTEKTPKTEVATPTTSKEEAVSDKDVIARMNNKTIITKQSLESEKADLMEAEPQLKEIFSSPKLSAQLDHNLIEGLANQAVIDEYMTTTYLPNNPEIAKQYEKRKKQMERSTRHINNAQFFNQSLKPTVTDEEVRKYYDDKKESIPQLLLSHGGVKTVGVSFDSQEEAQNFMNKVNENKGDLQKTAETADLKEKIQNFNLVNEHSIGINPQLRDKIVALKKVPTTQVIKLDDKTYWVVHATEKHETKYQPFELVKGDIARVVEHEKQNKLIEEKLKELRKQFNVEIRESEQTAPEAAGQERNEEELFESDQE